MLGTPLPGHEHRPLMERQYFLFQKAYDNLNDREWATEPQVLALAKSLQALVVTLDESAPSDTVTITTPYQNNYDARQCSWAGEILPLLQLPPTQRPLILIFHNVAQRTHYEPIIPQNIARMPQLPPLDASTEHTYDHSRHQLHTPSTTAISAERTSRAPPRPHSSPQSLVVERPPLDDPVIIAHHTREHPPTHPQPPAPARWTSPARAISTTPTPPERIPSGAGTPDPSSLCPPPPAALPDHHRPPENITQDTPPSLGGGDHHVGARVFQHGANVSRATS